jgi:hypothetical protein
LPFWLVCFSRPWRRRRCAPGPPGAKATSNKWGWPIFLYLQDFGKAMPYFRPAQGNNLWLAQLISYQANVHKVR